MNKPKKSEHYNVFVIDTNKEPIKIFYVKKRNDEGKLIRTLVVKCFDLKNMEQHTSYLAINKSKVDMKLLISKSIESLQDILNKLKGNTHGEPTKV